MSVRDEQLIRPVWPWTVNHNSVQAQGLARWWPMAFPGGDRLHEMMSNDRTFSPAFKSPSTQLWTYGPIANALNNTTAVAIATYTADDQAWNTADYTFTAWVRGTSFGASSRRIICRQDGSGSPPFKLFGFNSSKVYVGDSSGGLQTGTATVSTGTWQFIAGRRISGSTRATFVNGVLDSSAAAASTVSPYDATDPVVFGAWNYTSNAEAMTGEVADIRLYTRALSDAEIWALYEPSTRYELYYPLGRRLWFFPSATVNLLSVSGSITPAGALVKQDSKTLSGAVTPAGTATKQANKGASGSVAPSGSVVRSFASALAGALTPSGALAKVFSSTMSGSITPSGTLDALRTALLSLAGSMGLSGALARRASKGLSGSVTPAGGLAKRIGKLLSGAIAAAGALVTSLTTTNQKITCTLSDEAVTVASVSDELGG